MMESYSVKEKQEQIRENIDRICEEIVKAALSCGPTDSPGCANTARPPAARICAAAWVSAGKPACS